MRSNINLIKKNYISFLIIFVVFFLDRLSKYLIINNQGHLDGFKVLKNFIIDLNLIWNEGIAFGLLSFEESFNYNLLTIIILLITIFIFWLMLISSNFEKVGFAFIIGGSFGNITDRIYYSAVPDFIDLNYNGFHWFIFNVADIFISLGIVILILFEVKKKEK